MNCAIEPIARNKERREREREKKNLYSFVENYHVNSNYDTNVYINFHIWNPRPKRLAIFGVQAWPHLQVLHNRFNFGEELDLGSNAYYAEGTHGERW